MVLACFRSRNFQRWYVGAPSRRPERIVRSGGDESQAAAIRKLRRELDDFSRRGDPGNRRGAQRRTRSRLSRFARPPRCAGRCRRRLSSRGFSQCCREVVVLPLEQQPIVTSLTFEEVPDRGIAGFDNDVLVQCLINARRISRKLRQLIGIQRALQVFNDQL